MKYLLVKSGFKLMKNNNVNIEKNPDKKINIKVFKFYSIYKVLILNKIKPDKIKNILIKFL